VRIRIASPDYPKKSGTTQIIGDLEPRRGIILRCIYSIRAVFIQLPLRGFADFGRRAPARPGCNDAPQQWNLHATI
jgi:hypothetical protein